MLRKWFLEKLVLKADRDWLIEKLGGFRDLDSAIEFIREQNGEEKHRLLTLAVKKLFNTIGEDDILHVNHYGQWMFEGRPLSKEEINSLVQEATAFQNMKLWRVLQKDLKYQANKRMFVESRSEMDLVAGKLLVYLTDIVKTRLKRMLSDVT